MISSTAATTVDWLIYAIGGGHGHARRGWLLQRTLVEAGHSAVLLIRPGSDRHLPASSLPRCHGESFASRETKALRHTSARGIVVDTFTDGWRGELVGGILQRFERRVWLARHGRNPANPGEFGRLVCPYPAAHCEWDQELPGTFHAGYLVEADHLDLAADAGTFALVDCEHRCNLRLLALFRSAARRCGLGFRLHRRLDEPIRARKLLVAGAGYHTFYECLGQNMDVRFIPVRKRHDDQFRRAQRFGRALEHLDQLLPWLGDGWQPIRHDVVFDRNAILSSLGLATL